MITKLLTAQTESFFTKQIILKNLFNKRMHSSGIYKTE